MIQVNQYIEDVLSGKQIASKWIKLVLQRHLDDLERQYDPDFPFYFSPELAQRPIDFIEKHVVMPEENSVDGETVKLLAWQQAWIALMYGWLRKEGGTRRFRVSLLCIGKKNGKTTLAGALSIYDALMDGQESARVAIAAVTREQGKECLVAAAKMVQSSPFLRKYVSQTGGKTDIKAVQALYVAQNASRISVMSRDHKSQDGAKVSHSIIDELHRWETKQGLYMVLRYGGKAFAEPLMIEITTVGDAALNTSPLWEEYEHGMKILDPATDDSDDTFLPFLFVFDKGDDWQDQKNWYKTNPSMGPKDQGFLFTIDRMVDDYVSAKHKPGELKIFRRYSLNEWLEGSDEPAVEIEKWDDCCRVTVNNHPNSKRLRAETIEQLAGRSCFVALDPSQKGDTSALSSVFPPLIQGEPYRTLEHFWLPAENIGTKGEKDKVPYDLWAADGFLTLTPGNVIDKRVIARDILALNKQFDIRELVYDEAHATEIISLLLEEGFPEDKLAGFPQTRVKLSEPCHNWVQRVLRKEIAHDHNPVMRWQVGNLCWNRSKINPDEIMPDKRRGREKIDGCVAQIMAFARATSPENIVKPKRKFFIAFPSED